MARVLLVLASLATLGAGCIRDDDVGAGEIRFKLPTAIFKINSDPNEPQWRAMPADEIPDVVCSGSAALTDDCCNPPARGGEPAKAVDCQRYPLACDAAGWCALTFDFDAHPQDPIDLGSNVPALHDRRGWVLANADMAVVETTLTETKISETGVVENEAFPIESAALYVAPLGVLSPKAATSSFLADIPLEAASSVTLDANARSALSTFLVDFNTPFTLILSMRVAVEAQHQKGLQRSPNEIRKATFTIEGDVRANF